jgi:hypothetical protein
VDGWGSWTERLPSQSGLRPVVPSANPKPNQRAMWPRGSSPHTRRRIDSRSWQQNLPLVVLLAALTVFGTLSVLSKLQGARKAACLSLNVESDKVAASLRKTRLLGYHPSLGRTRHIRSGPPRHMVLPNKSAPPTPHTPAKSLNIACDKVSAKARPGRNKRRTSNLSSGLQLPPVAAPRMARLCRHFPPPPPSGLSQRNTAGAPTTKSNQVPPATTARRPRPPHQVHCATSKLHGPTHLVFLA